MKIDTVDIVAVLHEQYPSFTAEYMQLMKLRHQFDGSVVKWVESKLGKAEEKRKIGNRFFYVWQVDGLQILVHNVSGLCIEIDENASAQTAWMAWCAFKKRMGLS